MATPLTIWHVGGDGHIGPAQYIKDAYPDAVVTVFDARDGHGERLCFAHDEGEMPFYVTRSGTSSSLYPPAPHALDQWIAWEGGRIDKWRDLVETEIVTEVRVTTIDAYRDKHNLPAPDVLSLDVQGAEWAVMSGAVNTLTDVLAVVSEVEFSEIYLHQMLFDDQMEFLRGSGFRLARLFNPQHWHPAAPMGEGLLTVAEATWLRYGHGIELLSKEQLVKLAAIAHAWKHYSYAKLLMERANGQA